MHTKHHTTGPVGGMVFTKSEALIRQVRLLADRGKPPVDEVDWRTTSNCRRVATLNFNLGDIGAAIGKVQIGRLSEGLARRRSFARAVSKGCERLCTFRVNTFGREIDDCAFWYLFIQADLVRLGLSRDALVARVAAQGIPFFGEDLELVTRAPWYRDGDVFGTEGPPPGEFAVPEADSAAATHLSLELHENLGPGEAADTVAALAAVESQLV